MGYTTQLFAETLDFLVYADTQFVLSVLAPGAYTLKRTAKRGPRKSPDYLALDANLNINVLECKGSQSSTKDLIDAIKIGAAQKNNLIQLQGPKLKYALVAGLFIPQWANSESALIHIQDPIPKDLIAQLRKSPKEHLIISVIQIGLAKHFALMGFHSLANSLSTAKVVHKENLQRIDRSELTGLTPSGADQQLVFDLNLPLRPTRIGGTEQEVRSIRFTMRCSRDLYERLIESTDLANELLILRRGSKEE